MMTAVPDISRPAKRVSVVGGQTRLTSRWRGMARGARQIGRAVPPSFFRQGAARALFVPLSLTVGFAMVTSYLLASTFVPVLSTWIITGGQDATVRPAARGPRGPTAGPSGRPSAGDG